MKCAQVKLAERKTARRRKYSCEPHLDHPIRYCQLKQVNPQYEEDPKWKIAALKRFHLTSSNSLEEAEYDSSESKQNKEDTNMNKLFLTVLNLNFPMLTRSSRVSLNYRNKFKFRTCPKSTDKCYHRMFVKEPLDISELEYDSNSDLSSSAQLDKFDEYVKTILTADENSITSSPLPILTSLNNRFATETHENNNSTQDYQRDLQDFPGGINMSVELKHYVTNNSTEEDNDEECINSNKMKNATRRKSITVSRTQSPETVQVIRVDVMCNYSRESSIISELGDDPSLRINNVDSVCTIKTKALQKFNMQKRNKLNADNKDLAIYCKSLKYNERPGSRATKTVLTLDIPDTR